MYYARALKQQIKDEELKFKAAVDERVAKALASMNDKIVLATTVGCFSIQHNIAYNQSSLTPVEYEVATQVKDHFRKMNYKVEVREIVDEPHGSDPYCPYDLYTLTLDVSW